MLEVPILQQSELYSLNIQYEKKNSCKREINF